MIDITLQRESLVGHRPLPRLGSGAFPHVPISHASPVTASAVRLPTSICGWGENMGWGLTQKGLCLWTPPPVPQVEGAGNTGRRESKGKSRLCGSASAPFVPQGKHKCVASQIKQAFPCLYGATG